MVSISTIVCTRGKNSRRSVFVGTGHGTPNDKLNTHNSGETNHTRGALATNYRIKVRMCIEH